MTKLHKHKPYTGNPILSLEKINKLFAGLGSGRIVKNCDHGLENAALGLRPWAAFLRSRSQFFTIRTFSRQITYKYCPRYRRTEPRVNRAKRQHFMNNCLLAHSGKLSCVVDCFLELTMQYLKISQVFLKACVQLQNCMLQNLIWPSFENQ